MCEGERRLLVGDDRRVTCPKWSLAGNIKWVASSKQASKQSKAKAKAKALGEPVGGHKKSS